MRNFMDQLGPDLHDHAGVLRASSLSETLTGNGFGDPPSRIN